MALTTVTVHIKILAPVTNTPAVGTVSFRTLIELRDVVDNITYAPMTFTATLVAGEATIVIPATNNADLVPASWVYQVIISTDILTDTQYMQIPFAPGTTEFADLVPLAYDPCTQVITATPLAPGSEGLFVLKAGDTMTGNLVINANLQVSGSASASYEGVSGDIVRLLSTALSTGLVSGGDINFNVDPTKIDITAMTGWIIDYNPSGTISATNPKITYVTKAAQTGLLPTVGVPTGVTWWMLDSTGAIIQQATRPTPTQRRSNLVIGATAQVAGNIVETQSLPTVQSQPMNQLVDLMDALGNFEISGNQITPNGVNLSFNKADGLIFARAFNEIPTYNDPHTFNLPAQAPVNFRHVVAPVGGAGALTTFLDVGNYDPNGAGVVTPIPGGANTATNFRVFGFGANATVNQVLVQYGQSTYSSLANAVAAIGSTNFIVNGTAAAVGVLLGWISVIKSATDLSNTTQATFTSARSKFNQP